MNRKTRVRRLTSRLRQSGNLNAARRLVEAFDLDDDFGTDLQDITDESIADIDDSEIALRARDLAIFIPTAATLPDELEDEESLVFDTGVFRVAR